MGASFCSTDKRTIDEYQPAREQGRQREIGTETDPKGRHEAGLSGPRQQVLSPRSDASGQHAPDGSVSQWRNAQDVRAGGENGVFLAAAACRFPTNFF